MDRGWRIPSFHPSYWIDEDCQSFRSSALLPHLLSPLAAAACRPQCCRSPHPPAALCPHQRYQNSMQGEPAHIPLPCFDWQEDDLEIYCEDEQKSTLWPQIWRGPYSGLL